MCSCYFYLVFYSLSIFFSFFMFFSRFYLFVSFCSVFFRSFDIQIDKISTFSETKRCKNHWFYNCFLLFSKTCSDVINVIKNARWKRPRHRKKRPRHQKDTHFCLCFSPFSLLFSSLLSCFLDVFSFFTYCSLYF